MSQFDQTTKRKQDELPPTLGTVSDDMWRTLGFKEGRNSTKASMEILARALERICDSDYGGPATDSIAERAISQVKASGDWPLESE